MDLLFRDDSTKKVTVLSEETAKDLALDEIIALMTGEQEERQIIRKLMIALPSDTDDSVFRQEIIRDILSNRNLYNDLRGILDKIKVLGYYGGSRKALRDKNYTLFSLLEDVRELSLYVETVEGLYKCLGESNITSRGLISLRNEIGRIAEDDEFNKLKPDIRKIEEDLSNVKGAVVGVNFTADLNVAEVMTVEFVPYEIKSEYGIVNMLTASQRRSDQSGNIDPLMAGLAPKLEKHLKKHYKDIRKILSECIDQDTRFITEMYEGFLFYLSAVNMAHKLQERGYEFTFPTLQRSSGYRLMIRDFYNVRLAVMRQENIVRNDFVFTDKEKIFILTGPNRGGKTIAEQGLGIVSLMASLGMFVTAGECSGIPFGYILTHFPIDENLTINYGRLGEEAVRIKEIVKSSDENTLILFNETFSTTSETDALYLSMDLLHVLKSRGSGVIFNTHIHELAARIPDMDRWDGMSDIVSIVMEIKDNVNTFKIKRSAPDTTSYARNIALKYGITYEQMMEDNIIKAS